MPLEFCRALLTALFGCVNAQLFSHIVPGWVAEGAAVGPSLTAVVEVEPKDRGKRPGPLRLPMGSPVLVH